jgi:lysine 2,3-aminomutase
LTFLQVANTVQGAPKLHKFLSAVLPDHVPYDRSGPRTQSREELIKDVFDGVTAATMAIRIT